MEFYNKHIIKGLMLLHIMLATILLGTLGYLSAIFLTILAGQVVMPGILTGAVKMAVPLQNMWLIETLVKTIITVMIVIAVLRGILHYVEQYCNHFIAFKLLAIIRHKVFAALRKLCPAKLEGRDKGKLISIITTDIELLEVFYVHTISLYGKGTIGFEGILTCTIAMMGFFGPVVALSSLSNNLNQTLASGERVLILLEETSLVEEIPDDEEPAEEKSADWQNHRHPWGKRLRKVYSFEIVDAVLGCTGRKCSRGRHRRQSNTNQTFAGYGKLCYAGNTFIP